LERNSGRHDGLGVGVDRSRDEAERYAAGLLKVTKGVKIVVTPERVASFDTGKDETLRTIEEG